MVCPNCGNEVPEGFVYCPKCGEEVQVITAVDELEEEILKGFMDDSGHDDSTETKNPETEKWENKISKRPVRPKRLRNRIITVVIIAAAAVVIGLVAYNRTRTPESLFARAEENYAQHDYDNAVSLLKRLLSQDEDNVEAVILLGKCYEELNDYVSAETMFMSAIDLDPDSIEAYECVIELYDIQGKRDKILELRKTVTNEAILALFDDYITPEPVIEVESGTFSDDFTVVIRAPENDLSIYYTLDESDPTEDGILYDGPIEIDIEGLTTLTAVCMDEEGYYSEPVSEVYLLEFKAPDKPSVTPDGGEFYYPQSVTVTVPPGTTVYYTWDNSTPNRTSERYTGPIDIPEGSNILSLVAIDSRGKRSDVLKVTYSYYPQTTSESVSSSSSSSSYESSLSSEQVEEEVTQEIREEEEYIETNTDEKTEVVDEPTSIPFDNDSWPFEYDDPDWDEEPDEPNEGD